MVFNIVITYSILLSTTEFSVFLVAYNDVCYDKKNFDFFMVIFEGHSLVKSIFLSHLTSKNYFVQSSVSFFNTWHLDSF